MEFTQLKNKVDNLNMRIILLFSIMIIFIITQIIWLDYYKKNINIELEQQIQDFERRLENLKARNIVYEKNFLRIERKIPKWYKTRKIEIK